jgi:integrase
MARIFQDTKEKRTLGSKAPWWVEWRENGNRRSQKVGTKKQAQGIASLKAAETLQRRNGLTIDKLWADFVREHESKAVVKMRSVHSKALTKEVLKRFGEYVKPKYVGLIDRRTLDDYAAKRLKDPGRKPGETLAAATVRKDLRTIRAALTVARQWNYLTAVPSLPKVDGMESDKRFVTMDHFEQLLKALDDDQSIVRQPRSSKARFEPADWWKALLMTLWVSGMRIGAALALRWDDVDLEAGTAMSRARHNKAKKDQRVDLKAAVTLLRALKGFDPRVFPWDRDRTSLYGHFERLQSAAGIHLPCPGDHEHTDRCHVYGFHDFRRAHATYNYGHVSDRDLQAQMGHATFETTKVYIKFAENHRPKAYDPVLPASMAKNAAGA